MSGQMQQQANAAHSIQQPSQQQQQQQIGPHTSQPMNVPAQNNQQNLLQQQQQQDNAGQLLQIPIQGSQNFQHQPGSGQQTPQIFSPQITPQQNPQYEYAPNPQQQQQQTQNQAQTQGLQQVPPQPLFQQQSGQLLSLEQQNVIISPQQQQLSQQHVIMQHQMMQPQQQYQQQLQQQMAMLQTPILHSSAPATPTKANAVKKGRFRVVKGAPTEAKATAAGANDAQTVVASNDAQTGGVDKTSSQPVSTVKKGRFLVKKSTIAGTSAASEATAKAGKQPNPQSNDTAKVAKKTTIDKDASNVGRVASADQTKATGVAFKETGKQVDNNSSVQPATAKPAQAANPCTKKKGRFIVKTGGGSTPNLQATEAKSPPAATTSEVDVASLGPGDPPKAAEKAPNQKTSGINNNCMEETVKLKGKGSDDKSGPKRGDRVRRNSSVSSKGADAVAASQVVSTKKKGRFVVKTGGAGAAVSSPNAANPTTLSCPEGTQSGGNSQHAVQLTPCNQQMTNYVVGNIPISVAGMPATSFVPATSLVDVNGQISLVDVNGQMMVVSNVALPLPLPQTIQQQHPLQQQIPASQPQVVPPQFVNAPVQGGVPNVGSPQPQPQLQAPLNSSEVHPSVPSLVDANGQISLVDVNGQMMVVSNLALPLPIQQTVQQHPLQQQIPASQPQVPPQFVNAPVQNAVPNVGGSPQPQLQPPLNVSEVHPPAPLAPRPRVMTEERPENVTSVAKPNYVPRPSRGGRNNGRLIGAAGGVGKVLHYLDALRLEVVDADRSITTLQSDNRFLREKNKELESKVTNLERWLAEEKALRQMAETKYRNFRQRVRDQEIDPIQPQAGSGSHQIELERAPSADASTIKTNESWRGTSNHSLNNQTVNEGTHEQKLEHGGSTSFEDLQPVPEKPKINRSRAQTGPDPKQPPISQNNSFEASDAKQTHQPTTGQSSFAKQFDPLGTIAPSFVQQTINGGTTNQQSIPTATSIVNENATIPSIVTTTPTPPPPTHIADPKYTPCINNKKKHFDPLGTPPERSEISASIPAVEFNGMPQMPGLATRINNGHVAVPVIVPLIHHRQQQQQHQQPRNQHEDPFDEIVRMSNSHSTL